jgi:hypothetical protein
MVEGRVGFGVAGVLVAALLTGCAGPSTKRVGVDASARAQEEVTQQRLAIKTAFDLERRLWVVGYAVLKGAASECGSKVRQSLGFRYLTYDRLPSAQRDLIASALGVDTRLRVMAVYKDSAADLAGLKEGDILVDPSSPALTPSTTESKEAAALRLPPGKPISLAIQRNGVPMTLQMKPDTVCDYPMQVTNGGEVNAYADGSSIKVSRGMMRFAAEDRELALVVGHELGHNTMGHLDKRKINMAVGAVFDILAAAYRVDTGAAFTKAGAGAFSQDFEAEADYVGLYYLARAGYETEGAASFWRRMAAEHPASIKNAHSATHPATTERFLALEQVHQEVHRKLTGGLELTPDRK